MHIIDSDGRAHSAVSLALTVSEAIDLMGQLDSLVAAADVTDHRHVSSADYRTEVTVMLYREGEGAPWKPVDSGAF